MESLNFNLQIDMFFTNTDEWENKESFWCIYNEGYFRNVRSGNCQKFEDKWWRIGKVKKNRYNSFDLIQEHNDKIYRTDDEALMALEELEMQLQY